MKRFWQGWVTGFLVWGLGFSVLAEPEPPRPEDKSLLADLGSDEFAVRESAQEGLTKWAMGDFGARADLFLDMMWNSEDPEIQTRCRAILKDALLGGIEESGPGFMGIVMSRLVVRALLDGEQRQGVGVEAVQPDTPAEKSGLIPGDLLVQVDDLFLDTPDGSQKLQRHVTEVGAGNKITLHVIRNGELKEVPLVLMRTPLRVEHLRRHPRRFGVPSEEELQEMEFQRWLGERVEKRDAVKPGEKSSAPAASEGPE